MPESNNPLSQTIYFTTLKACAALATQPLFVAKVAAQNNFQLGFLEIVSKTTKDPFRGAAAGATREVVKAPLKLGSAYLGNYTAEHVIAPFFSDRNSSTSLVTMNITRGTVAGFTEGTFATFINAWRTYVITRECNTTYIDFLRKDNDGSLLSMAKKGCRGWRGTVFKQGLMTTTTFGGLDLADKIVMPNLPEDMNTQTKKAVKSVFAGSISALCVALLDTALVHQQGAQATGHNIFEICKTIVAEHGAKGLFRGSGFNFGLLAVGATLNAMFFDKMRQKTPTGEIYR